MLKLYRPVHNLAWLLERLEKLCSQLEEQQKVEKDTEKRRLLEAAAGKAARKCVETEKLFRAVYRGVKVFQESWKETGLFLGKRPDDQLKAAEWARVEQIEYW